MPNYILARRADNALEHFYQEGIERHGLSRADTFLDNMYIAFSKISADKNLGTQFVIGSVTFKKWIVQPYPYVIFYVEDGEDTRIVRIYDMRSNYLPNLSLDLQIDSSGI